MWDVKLKSTNRQARKISRQKTNKQMKTHRHNSIGRGKGQ